MDERAFIARVESADPSELARLLSEPAAEEEGALRNYLGDEAFEEMRSLAARQIGAAAEVASEPIGNVVVTHGILGSSLSAVDERGDLDWVWLNPLFLVFRSLNLLRLSDDGRTGFRPEYDVRATGLLLRYYGKQVLSLRNNWNVYPFWFDWRKDLNAAASELNDQINRHFGEDAPVHIIAHSMGGLVARTFIKNHRERWEKMWDERSGGRSGGRLVMLGTPNHGSFAVPLLINGLSGVIRWLAAASQPHTLRDVLEITNSFVGTYQMLPSPYVMPSMQPLYDSQTYADLPVPQNVPQRRLDEALQHHAALRDVIDTERMIYVAGYNHPTINGISDFAKLHSIEEGYSATLTAGDGTVPHELGFLETSQGEKVKTYFVDEAHVNLPRNGQVVAALEDLLGHGTTRALSDALPAPRQGQGLGPADAAVTATQTGEEEEARALAEEILAQSAESAANVSLSPEEGEFEEMLMRGF
jgi:pimeloyl-ACP methyl ester carboxylesterase